MHLDTITVDPKSKTVIYTPYGEKGTGYVESFYSLFSLSLSLNVFSNSSRSIEMPDCIAGFLAWFILHSQKFRKKGILSLWITRDGRPASKNQYTEMVKRASGKLGKKQLCPCELRRMFATYVLNPTCDLGCRWKDGKATFEKEFADFENTSAEMLRKFYNRYDWVSTSFLSLFLIVLSFSLSLFCFLG